MARTMKNSGVEWIGDIPADWEVCRIKNLANIFAGNSIKDEHKGLYEDEVEAIPYISTKDIDATLQTINFSNGMYVKQSDESFRRALPHSILLCIEGGSAGKKIAYTDREVCFVNKLCCFHSSMCFNKYLYYQLMSPLFTEPFNSHIAGLIGGVSVKTLSNFKILQPPLDEQQRIAAFLDGECARIDSVVEKTRASIEEYRKLKQAIITRAVTKGIRPNRTLKHSGIDWLGDIPADWEVVNIRKFFSFGKGLSITKEDLRESGISVVSYGQIHSKFNNGTALTPELIRFVDDDYLQSSPQSLVKRGDFIFADTSEDLDGCGNCVYVDTDDLIFAGYHTIILRNKTCADLKYCAFLFQSDAWRKQIRERVMGVKLFSISQKILRATNILLLPLDEQKEIAAYLDEKTAAIDSLVAKKNRLVSELESLKKSLIFEYVTGKKEVPK